MDGGRQRRDTAGIHAQGFAGGEVALFQHAACVNKRQAVAFQFLHDETFAAKQADTEFLLKGDAERYTFGGAQERIFLADQQPAQFAQVHCNNGAGVGGGKCHAAFGRAKVLIHRGKQRFAG